MKAKTNLLLDSIIFLAFLVAFEPHITGTQIHEWLGAAFFLTLLAHLILHWKWVVNTLSKFFRKMTWSNRLNFIVDFFVFLGFIVLNLSGLMISKFLLQSLGIEVSGGGTWKQIHSLSAELTLYLTALHFALHWNWLAAAVKNHIIRPASGLFTGSKKFEPQPARIDER